MEEDTPEYAQARRHRRILLACVALGVGLPLVLLIVRHVRLGS
ncbi:MAG TPA: hypothetical protein VEQ65_02490 [Opitutus sp.]|nr:hypothetical protein [Opitutus sp.]